MSKRDWYFVIGSLLLVWFVDQGTKWLALEYLGHLEFFGPIGLVLHRNPGAIFGAFSDLPPLLRVVSLSTGGAFLIFIYGCIQYLLPRRSFQLRMGMSLLLGGILGNVTDRLVEGSVVDWILFGNANFTTPAFNFADAIQWVGYALVVFSLLREGSQIWPTGNERKTVWVNRAFQFKYISKIVFIGLAFAVINGVFSYTYLWVTIEDIARNPSDALMQKFLNPFLMVFMIMSFSFAVMLFIVGKILSHRMAGPLYAFELFLDDILHGKDRPLRLRAGDEFRHLEQLSEEVRSKLGKNFKSLQSDQEESEQSHLNGDSELEQNTEEETSQEAKKICRLSQVKG